MVEPNRVLNDRHWETVAIGFRIIHGGSAYPNPVKATQPSALIFAVCDVYDALISERPYKRAWTVEGARAEIASQVNRHFCPGVMAAFLSLTEEQKWR